MLSFTRLVLTAILVGANLIQAAPHAFAQPIDPETFSPTGFGVCWTQV